MSDLLKKVPQDCLDIMGRIAAKGGKVFLVGGCVRDLLLKQSSSDWDIVTNLVSSELFKLFPQGHYHGKSFSVFTVDGIEIATFRGQSCRQSSLEEDLRHRDFTINAMALDIKGNLWDFFGGQKDLKDRIVRFVENPHKRINEDYCRMLRACRFVGYLAGTLDPQSAKAISYNSESIRLVARERVRKELLKMMELVELESAVLCMQKNKLIKWILPLLSEYQNKRMSNYGQDKNLFIHYIDTAKAISHQKPILRLAALLLGPCCEPNGNLADVIQRHTQTVRDFLLGFRFSFEEIHYISEAIEKLALSLNGFSRLVEFRRFISRLDIPLQDFLEMYQAHLQAIEASEDMQAVYNNMVRDICKIKEENSALKLKDLKIDGRTLKSLGMKPGPVFSEILEACLEEVLRDPSKNDKNYLMEYAKNLYYQ